VRRLHRANSAEVIRSHHPLFQCSYETARASSPGRFCFVGSSVGPGLARSAAQSRVKILARRAETSASSNDPSGARTLQSWSARYFCGS